MSDLIALARPMTVGFHRAFDQLADQAAGRISILAGGGIMPDNVRELLDRSGVHQVHGKAFAGLRDAALR